VGVRHVSPAALLTVLGMEIKDVIEILIVIVGGIAAYFRLENSVNVQAEKLIGHIKQHEELSDRVSKHEEKLDSELKAIHGKIESNHKEITDKLSDIKVLIEQIRK
jgi:oligoendopeptidase F